MTTPNEPQNPSKWTWERQPHGGWWLRQGGRLVAYVSHSSIAVEGRALIESRLNAHDELVAALEELASCEELDLSMYGSFPGGDPRCFEPDEEVTTPEEIANWREACEAWNRGEGVDRGPSCQTLGDGSAVTGTGYGMGVFRWQHPAAANARALLARVRGEESHS